MNSTIEACPAIDRNEFRAALGLFPTGVAVVTAGEEGVETRIGMTITSFNSVSLDPPLVLFSIDRRALSLQTLRQARMYSINVLGEQHEHISNRFATAKGDKWSATEIEVHDGLPFTLAHAIVSFQCAPYAEYDGGDHLIFVGRVLRIHKQEHSAPLVFFGGRYAYLQQPAPAASN